MRQLSLTSFAGVVLVVLFFEGGQASDVPLEALEIRISNDQTNKSAVLSEVVPVNGVTKPPSMCCVTGLHRNDYTVTPGIGVHKFVKQPMTWNAARDTCIRDGAQLAVINSDAEETLLRFWKNQNSVNSVWMGVHDHFERDWWVTLAGEPLATMGYNLWAPHQPAYNDNNEHCGVLWNDQDKGIENTRCNWKFSFFCEINLC